MKIFRSMIVALACGLLAVKTAIFADDATTTRAVLVTGASSGISLRIAETLAKNGFYVFAESSIMRVS